MRGGFAVALANLRRHGIRVYGTFVFGYDGDEPGSFDEAAEFAIDNSFYLAAFNHLTPFPGTPLYDAPASAKGRLLHERWWLDERYRLQRPPVSARRPWRPTTSGTGASRAPAVLQLERACCERAFDPVNRARRLHVPQFLPHQRHAPRRGRQARPLPARRSDLERTVAQGGVSGRTFVAGNLAFAVAQREDEPTSAACCARTRLDGWMRLSLRARARRVRRRLRIEPLARLHPRARPRDRRIRRHLRTRRCATPSSTARSRRLPYLGCAAGRAALSPPPPRAARAASRRSRSLLQKTSRPAVRADRPSPPTTTRRRAAAGARLPGAADLSAGGRLFDLRAPRRAARDASPASNAPTPDDLAAIAVLPATRLSRATSSRRSGTRATSPIRSRCRRIADRRFPDRAPRAWHRGLRGALGPERAQADRRARLCRRGCAVAAAGQPRRAVRWRMPRLPAAGEPLPRSICRISPSRTTTPTLFRALLAAALDASASPRLRACAPRLRGAASACRRWLQRHRPREYRSLLHLVHWQEAQPLTTACRRACPMSRSRCSDAAHHLPAARVSAKASRPTR